MPDSKNPPTPPGFDARRALETFGPPKAQRDTGGITMGVPTNAEMERQSARRDPVSRHEKNEINESSYAPSRILWPALGFPAMIDPSAESPAPAARSICLLLLSDRDPDKGRRLAKIDVARHLRCVPWAQRHTRWLPTREKGGTNAFREEDIEVRAVRPIAGDGILTQRIRFAADADGENGVYVGIAKEVLEFYAERGLKYLYEIRISESASRQFGTGRFQLLWINPRRKDLPPPGENERSAEMDCLLEHYVSESRFGHDGILPIDQFVGPTRAAQLKKYSRDYEYEFEFGGQQVESAATRVEVLHPLFIGSAKPEMRVAHLTDLHVNIRANTYEQNLPPAARSRYHNVNRACENLYSQAGKSCDLLLMTGDLVDFGRDHNEQGPLGEDQSYWRDRGWFLFYKILAGGDRYQKPSYTILGNHDWRINPYPPLTTGAPAAKELNLTPEELRQAHGPGADKFLFYPSKDIAKFAVGAKKKLWDRDGRLAVAGTPLEVQVGSIGWYLLLINPFLDYACTLPGGYGLVMLDWACDEEVDLPTVKNGTNFGRGAAPNTDGGPRAWNCLTPNQRDIFEYIADGSSPAKILGIHAPPLGPWSEWGDHELAGGWITSDDEHRMRGDSGAKVYSFDQNGNRFREPNTFQIQAFQLQGEPAGREADYGSFRNGRTELIRKLRETGFQVVLSGHIHRQNLLVLERPVAQTGGFYVKSIRESDAKQAELPVFVNSTSAGPLGHVFPRTDAYQQRASGYSEIVLSAAGKIEEVRFVSDPQNVLLKRRERERV